MLRTLIAFALIGSLQPAVFGRDAGAGSPIDVSHYLVEVEIEPERSFLSGRAEARLRVSEEIQALPFDVNAKLSVLQVTGPEGQVYSVRFDDFDNTRMFVRSEVPFPVGADFTLTFRFEGILEREQYAFLDTPRTEQAVIDSEGALLLSEGKWFPSHNLPLDSATAEIRVTVPLGYTAVGPGRLDAIETQIVSESFVWSSDHPAGEFPVVVSRFYRKRFESQPFPVTFYVTQDFTRDLEPYVDLVSEALSFLKAEYGPVETGEFNFAQVGNFLLGSAGAPGLIFLESGLLDSRSLPVAELVRRLARQWWGHSLRFRDVHDAWLADGFSTYASLRYLEVKDSERFNTELARRAVDTLKYERRAPVVRGLDLRIGSPEYDSVVASKGAWVLYMLRQLIGDDTFHGLIRDWYMENRQRTATTSEFIEFVERRTDQEYRWFFVQWLESVGVPEFKVEYAVFKISGGGFSIRGQIHQDLELFRMPVDITIETKGKPEHQQLRISGRSTPFSFETEAMPLRLEIDPQGKILRDSPQMRISVHIALGEELRERGELISAIQEFERARELNPRHSLAHFRLGEVFFEQQSFTNAANSFRDVLNGDLKPEWVETWTHIYLGKVYDILGQRQRALAEYQKAINTQIDHEGAQAEAERYLKEPYSRPTGILG